ncbi:hypothetical protein [Streptomyces sp. NPDC093260]|uniref:hypothetical protein n=1 Tax=Streptomyces sp. NPDC093260 TaxID=3155073 RepID=UPI00341ACBEA
MKSRGRRPRARAACLDGRLHVGPRARSRAPSGLPPHRGPPRLLRSPGVTDSEVPRPAGDGHPLPARPDLGQGAGLLAEVRERHRTALAVPGARRHPGEHAPARAGLGAREAA